LKIKGKSLQLKLMGFAKYYPMLNAFHGTDSPLAYTETVLFFQNMAVICTEVWDILPLHFLYFLWSAYYWLPFLLCPGCFYIILSVCLFFRVHFTCTGKIHQF